MQDEKDSYPIDDYSLKTFPILRDYLEPGTKLTLESTASSILNLLPDFGPYPTRHEERAFSDLCIEMGEQIPYNHPSQLKLVELLAYIGMSEKLGEMAHLIEVPRIVRYAKCRSPLTFRRVPNLANFIATSSWVRKSGKALMVGALNSSLLSPRCSQFYDTLLIWKVAQVHSQNIL